MIKNILFNKNFLHIILILIICILATPATFASGSEDNHHQESESSHQNDDDHSDDDDDKGSCGNKSDDDSDDDGDSDEHKRKSSDSHHDKKDHDSGHKDDHKDDDKGDDDGDHKDDDDKHDDNDCEGPVKKPLGTAHILIDNTAAFSNYAVLTNMSTAASPSCSKQDVLKLNRCNSFSLGQNDILVIQNDVDANLTKMIGVNNNDSSSYENKGTETQLEYFSPGKHLIDMDSIRSAATKIENSKPPLPEGTFGNISFKQFIQNVALGRSMYGVVRVAVPLSKVTSTTPPPKDREDKNDDGNDDGDGSDDDGHDRSDDDNESKHDTNKHKTSSKHKTPSKHKTSSRSGSDSKHDNDDGDSDDDDGDDDRKPKYRLCGEDPTPQCLLCGPGNNTKIQSGKTVCGINLGNNAQVNVFGSLMFDWIDCDSKLPISLTDLRDSGKNIQFNLAVPVNINPAETNNNHNNMKTIKNITQIIGSSSCPSGSPCNLPLNNDIPFTLVSLDTKQNYEYKTGNELTEILFNSLTQANKFHLTMPSGYASGWATAFSALNIDAATWQSWGFNAPDVSGVLTTNDIRNDRFQDMPAFLYSGGIVGLHHNTNISGLLYIPQALDLEQNGILLSNNNFTPSLQYISGAVIVRDGFYLEAKYEGGATLISNNPDSYSEIKLDASSGQAGKFERFAEVASTTNDSTDQSDNDDSGNSSGNSSGGSGSGNNNNNSGNNQNGNNNFPNTNSVSPGAQWMEIRPQ